MDLAQLDSKKKAEAGVRMNLVHPATGEDMTTFVEVLGTDSSTWQNMVREDLLKNVNKKSNKKIATEDDAIRIEKDIVIKLARMIKCFGDVEEKGKEVSYILFEGDKLKYSEDNAVKLLEALPWFKEQLNIFIGDRSNFLAD